MQQCLVVPELRARVEPWLPFRVSTDALVHGPPHRTVTQLARLSCMAIGLHRVPHEEIHDHLIGIDFPSGATKLRRLESRRTRPRVATALDHDKHHTRILLAIEVLVENHVLGHADPFVELALVELGPPMGCVWHGCIPVRRIADAPVWIDAVVRTVDRNDRHGPRRIVGCRESQPSNRCDPLDEGGELRGKTRAKASTSRIAYATDSVHVNAEVLRHMPQHSHRVFHIMRQVWYRLRMDAHVQALNPGTLQSGEGKIL
mmetsp:Transcript_72739/g.168581  ORF Transcript_72739/g.168581 Transcript_72739/m.168581 type:complete len:259 (+) Transcript_72739:249-1025(+)